MRIGVRVGRLDCGGFTRLDRADPPQSHGAMRNLWIVVAALALWQATGAPAGFEDLAAPQPADERGIALDGTSRITCSECHADIVAEWATTLHARAWVDEAFREELADVRRQESCHNCHIPEPLHLAVGADGALPQKPKPRDATPHDAPLPDVDAHFGVSCETCHRGPEGTILGPYGAKSAAHVSVKHASFLPESNSALCIACHATTVGPVIGIAKGFADVEPAANGLSCVGCHMAPVQRPAAEQAGKPAFPARSGRSHALQTPRDPTFLARAFQITVERRADDVVVRVANACGHRVPGRLGRTFALEATLLDGDDQVLATARHTIESKRTLPADGAIEMTLHGAGALVRGAVVHLVGVHESPALPDESRFLDRRFPLP